LTQTVNYTSGTFAPASVTDSYGNELTFSYDSNTGQLTSVTDPAGNTYSYSYDGNGYLTDVYYPDAAHRQYQYGDVNNPGALTAIVDENGVTYATWAYDSARRATLSQHAGNADSYSFTYNTDGTTTVANGAGGSRKYTFSVVNGVPKYTSIVEGTLTDSATWDSNGWPTTKVDRNGITTTYQYNARGLQTSRTEAYGTPSARTIATQWSSSYRLPTRITEPSYHRIHVR
jgi:YD repeat-containing protein